MLSGLRARAIHNPAALHESVNRLFVQFPFVDEIGFVDDDDEGHEAEQFLRALLDGTGRVERRAARPVNHQQVASRAAQVRSPELLHAVLALYVPEQEVDFLPAGFDQLLINLDADRRVIFVRIDALDKLPDETRFPDSERAEHAYFFLNHS